MPSVQIKYDNKLLIARVGPVCCIDERVRTCTNTITACMNKHDLWQSWIRMKYQQRDTEIVRVSVGVGVWSVTGQMRRSPRFPSPPFIPQPSPLFASFCQKAFILAPTVTLCCRQTPVWHLNTLAHRRACRNCVKSICVSLTVGVWFVTLRRGVSCVTNSNPDHSLWVSYLLQSYRKKVKRERERKKAEYILKTIKISVSLAVTHITSF